MINAGTITAPQTTSTTRYATTSAVALVRQIAEIASADTSHDAAALGPAATRRALERRTVRELYLTGRYLEDHMAEAEDAVRQALDQGALIEQVSHDAAARLDEHGGIAARLRYRAAGEQDGADALERASAAR